MTDWTYNAMTYRSNFTEVLKTKSFNFNSLDNRKKTKKQINHLNIQPKTWYEWQPKINQKKLKTKEQSKYEIFMLNKSRVKVERNSYSVINIQHSQISPSPKKKILLKLSKQNINQQFNKRDTYYEVQISCNLRSPQKQLKTPHMNFNMNLVIEKKKNLKNYKRKVSYWKKQINNNQNKLSINTNIMEKDNLQPKGNDIKGSNIPFYIHFLSKKYDKKRIQSASTRNNEAKSTIIRQLHIAPNEKLSIPLL